MKLVKINFKIAVVPHVRTCMSQLVVSATTPIFIHTWRICPKFKKYTT